MVVYPDERAHRIKHFIIEKLNAMQRLKAESLGGMYYTIGKYVPEKYVNQALAATQDKMWNTGRFQKHDAEFYFLGTLRRICKQFGVKSGIKSWDEKLDV